LSRRQNADNLRRLSSEAEGPQNERSYGGNNRQSGIEETKG